MALNLGTLVAYLTADTSDLDKGFENADGKVAGFAGVVPGYMAAAAAAIIAGAALAGAALFSLGSDFDDVADGFRINTTASGEDLTALADNVENIADRIPVSLDKIGPAVADVRTRLGLTGDTLETVTGQFLEMGRVLETEIDIDTASGALNVFKISGDDVSGSLDTLFQIAQSTGIGINELISGVESAGPITQQVGLDFAETAAMIGVFDKAGLDSQSMIGAMQKGLVNLTQPGESAEDAFARVTGQIQGFVDAGDMAAAIDLAGQVFGTRGAAQFVGALQTGAFELDNLIGSAQLSGDTIMGVAEETQDFGEKWQLFVNDAMIALEPIATRVFDAISSFMGDVGEAAGPAFAWIAENSATLEAFAVVAGSFAAAFLIVNGALAAYNLVMGIYQAITTAGSVAQWLLNVAMTANPIGIIIVAVGALIAIIVLLVMNWDTVIKFLGEAWANFTSWFSGVLIEVGNFFIDTWKNITSFVTTVWELFIATTQAIIANFFSFWSTIWTNVGSFILDVWRNFTTGVRIVWEGFIGLIMGAINAYVGFWTGVWSGVASFIAGIWQNIVTGVMTAWNGITSFLSGIPGAILGFFSSAGTWLMQTGRNIIDGLLNGLKNAMNAVWDWIAGIASGIADTFANILDIHSPSGVFRGFGVNIGEGLIEGLDAIQPDIDARLEGMGSAAPLASDLASVTEGSYNTTRNVTVVLQSDRTTLDEESIYDALDRERGM